MADGRRQKVRAGRANYYKRMKLDSFTRNIPNTRNKITRKRKRKRRRLLRRSLAKMPKILAPNGYNIFSNALIQLNLSTMDCIGVGNEP
jgi:hypothetical protein